MKILSKTLVLFFFLFFAFCFLFSPAPTFAEASAGKSVNAVSQIAPTQSNNKVAPSSNTNPDVANNLHNWTQSVMIEVMSSLTCQLAGVDPINPKQSCLGADQKTGKIGFLPSPKTGGAIGAMGNMITMLYAPPLHTADYFQNLAQNFGITKKTYAQQTGIGFQGLSPLMGIWSAFRNIAYMIFILVFVVIGLAIMLRIKIDPRTVMTIQNSIPKIIIGILLVTFSFAIAGFMIDIMYVLIYLFYGMLVGIPGVDISALNPAALQGKDAISAVGGMDSINKIALNVTTGMKPVLQDVIGVQRCNDALSCISGVFNPLNFVFSTSGIGFHPLELVYDLISWAAGVTMFFKVATIPNTTLPILSELEALFKTGGGATAGITTYTAIQYLLREGLPSIIIYLIVLIALLSALIRLWFNLLLAYIFILLHTVLAPFWIIASIIPGSPISFTGWLRDYAANTLVFPATIGLFMIGKAFMDVYKDGGFVPPLVGNINGVQGISSLIGLGIILTTPSVINALKSALKAPKIDISGVMQGLRAGTGTLTGSTKTMASATSTMLMGDPYTKDKGWKGLLQGLTRKLG